ncbi:hypothetical protein [Chthonobacter rhizosphaerae]|uniref:hypothetical protein n=1 Tax=Chthonobacter rhizosphaerae TaxID=2735553 RepID=UPI0015EE6509|nr:hypothetical protein [Chthonobacter rhizosphaerae]
MWTPAPMFDAEHDQDRDAAAAAARIEGFMAARAAGPEPAFDAVLAAIVQRISELMAIDVVAEDEGCRDILSDMVDAPDMETLAADIDRLDVRVRTVVDAARAAGREPRIANRLQPEARPRRAADAGSSPAPALGLVPEPSVSTAPSSRPASAPQARLILRL